MSESESTRAGLLERLRRGRRARRATSRRARSRTSGAQVDGFRHPSRRRQTRRRRGLRRRVLAPPPQQCRACSIALGRDDRSGGGRASVATSPATHGQRGCAASPATDACASLDASAEASDRASEPEVQHGVRDLRSPARLEERQQLEPSGVIRAVVQPAQRHDAVGVIAATERARDEVRGRDPFGLHTDDAGAADDLLPLGAEAANGARASPGRAVSERSGTRRSAVVRLGAAPRSSGVHRVGAAVRRSRPWRINVSALTRRRRGRGGRRRRAAGSRRPRRSRCSRTRRRRRACCAAGRRASRRCACARASGSPIRRTAARTW